MNNSDKAPWYWLFWHPHQGLWNWALVQKIQSVCAYPPLARFICFLLVVVDSCFLWIKALGKRISVAGLHSIARKPRVPEPLSVLYLDLGTYRDGAELALMVDVFLPSACSQFLAIGFEASHDSFKEVAKRFAGRKDVRLMNKAVVYQVPSNGKTWLFKDLNGATADSLYRKTAKSEEVSCTRLSDFLSENRLLIDNPIVLLRMNIEGSELDVIRDMVDAELVDRIDGYFGMWDDVSKIDMRWEGSFRELLMRNRIQSFTFNGRDLSWSIRKKCIQYELNTCLLAGIKKRIKQASQS